MPRPFSFKYPQLKGLPRVCVSIAEPKFARCKRLVSRYPLAEMRLDSADFSKAEIQRIVQASRRLIVTCRPGRHSERERLEMLRWAIEAGADFIDVELEAPAAYKHTLTQLAKANKCALILSHHDFKTTPSISRLLAILQRCKDGGAQVAKIATQVTKRSHSLSLMQLLHTDFPLVVVGMGAAGVPVRVAAPLFGSLFTFASPAKGRETAPGQLDVHSLAKIYEELGIHSEAL